MDCLHTGPVVIKPLSKGGGGGKTLHETKHYEFTTSQWRAVKDWSGYFGLPREFLAAVIAAEVLYDTDWYDPVMDDVIGMIAYAGIINPSSIFEDFLEASQSGLSLLGGRTFGPGIGQIHAATAIQAEQHFGEAFPRALPKRTASWRHYLLVQDETNIMYTAAILRMYADWRPESRKPDGQMSVQEMGAVFAAYHEALQTAFGSIQAYQEGAAPTSSGQIWVDQLTPLIAWYKDHN